VNVPERVSQVEVGVFYNDVRALLKSALAVGGTVKFTVPDHDAAAPVKGALAVHCLVFYYAHKHLG
jgi:hypothetical protein